LPGFDRPFSSSPGFDPAIHSVPARQDEMPMEWVTRLNRVTTTGVFREGANPSACARMNAAAPRNPETGLHADPWLRISLSFHPG